VELENVVPEAAETHEAPGEVGFEFNVSDGAGPFEATLELRYDDAGLRAGLIRALDRTVPFDQFIFP
jgi:hypothetical protein